jgi:hypothetical protein
MDIDPDVEVSFDFLEIIFRFPGSNNWIVASGVSFLLNTEKGVRARP